MYIFFHEIHDEDKRMFTIPVLAGWQLVSGHAQFLAAPNGLIPQIAHQYPYAFKNRVLVRSCRKILDTVNELTAAMPDEWEYKAAMMIRVTSLLLPFFEKCNHHAHHAFLFQPSGDHPTQLLIALLKTQDFSSTSTMGLSLPPTEIKEHLHDTNDGNALFRDLCSFSNRSRLSQNLTCILNDLNSTSGEAIKSRNLISILSEHPSEAYNDLPHFSLPVHNPDRHVDYQRLQSLSQEFDSALIQSIENEYADFNVKFNGLIREAAQKAEQMDIDPDFRETVKMFLTIISWILLLKHC